MIVYSKKGNKGMKIRIWLVLLLVHLTCHFQGCSCDVEPIRRPLDAVILTAADSGHILFPLSMESAMKHLVDVRNFYVICTRPKDLKAKYARKWGKRVTFVHQSTVGFSFKKIQSVIQAVVDAKITRVTGQESTNSFQKELQRKTGWYLQQLAKFYAGTVLKLDDYVVLDADIVWHKDVPLIDRSLTAERIPNLNRYLYAYSTQVHPAYASTMRQLLDIEATPGKHMSGIVHHIVVVKEVMEGIRGKVEAKHGLPLWQAMLNVSANELTSSIDRLKRIQGVNLAGKGSVLSEFDMYLHYARQFWPKTVTMRPLLWANGPQNNRIYWPNSDDFRKPKVKLPPDSVHRGVVWRAVRGDQVRVDFPRQLEADRLSGYDFVAYHSYASRRYYEMYPEDVDELGACQNVTKSEKRFGPHHSTCSWHHYNRSMSHEEWFRGCLCYHFSGRYQ